MKWLLKVVTTIVIIALAGLALLLAGLHTPYAPQMLAYILQYQGQNNVSIDAVEYNIGKPWHIQLIQLRSDGFSIPHVDAWLSPQSLWQRRWVFDGLRLEGKQSTAWLQAIPTIHVKRLALKNTSLSFPSLTLKNANIEVDNWHYNARNQQHYFSGSFQLTAPHWQSEQWQGEQLVVNGRYVNKLWRIDALTTQWLGGEVSISGDIDVKNGGYIDQLTLSNIKLQETGLIDLMQRQAEAVQTWPIAINRIDIVQSHIDTPQRQAQSINMSLQNWQWPLSWAEQKRAKLSFSADALKQGDWFLDSPLLEAHFQPGQASIDIATTKFLDGFVLAKGAFTPTEMLFDELRINGVDWVLQDTLSFSESTLTPSPDSLSLYTKLKSGWDHFDTVSVTQFHVGQSRITSNQPNWPWQLSGINASGQDVVLKSEGKTGLWQGYLDIGMARGSLNHVITQYPKVTMQSQAGDWKINTITMPFSQGILEGEASINLRETGQPWVLNLFGDNIPTSLYSRWLNLPILLEGNNDLTLSASGLAQSVQLAQYSLDAELRLQFRDTAIDGQQQFALWKEAPTEPNTLESVNVMPFKLTSDRGRISVTPWRLSHGQFEATFEGYWDLADEAASQLKLNAELDCESLQKQWPGGQASISSDCLGKMR